MVCQTAKVGVNCMFMKKAGCSFKGGKCYNIIDSCEGCDRIEEHPSGRYCKSYADPISKWSNGKCNFATHTIIENSVTKTKLNPLKASKRSISH